jgi:hypothetical protein
MRIHGGIGNVYALFALPVVKPGTPQGTKSDMIAGRRLITCNQGSCFSLD